MISELDATKSNLIRWFREKVDDASAFLNSCGDKLREKRDLKRESLCKGLAILIKESADRFVEAYKNNDFANMLSEYGLLFYFAKRLLEETEDIDWIGAKVKAHYLILSLANMICHFVKTVPEEQRQKLEFTTSEIPKYL